MSEHSRIAREIEGFFSVLDYPEDFMETYDQMECLTNRKGCEVFLLRRKGTEEQAIAKCYRKSVYELSATLDILKELNHPGIPKYIERYENDAMVCLVREYVEGVTLAERMRSDGMTQKDAIAYCLALCDILIYLHERKQPVIHRDIKPENIIIRPDNRLVLIDFDIARLAKPDSDTDTMFFGTRGYAPPEQYGFAQTDCRADIYAFGVLLRFLLTNSERPGKNVYLQPEIQRIIDKCTAFAPKERYGSMKAVKHALSRVRDRKPPNKPRWLLCTAVLALLMLCAGFALGRYTTLLVPAPSLFREPLIEKAVRIQLGAEDGRPLSEDMLAQVQRLFIHGTDVFSDPELYYARLIDDSTRGNIGTLADVALLPNLEQLCIGYQGQMDISGIEEGKNLRSVELKHVRVQDASPLALLPELEYLVLFDSGVSDICVLQDCVWLKALDVGMTRIDSMASVGVYPQLNNLSLKYLTMDTLAGIEKMPKLHTVMLNGAHIKDLSALLLLPELSRVFVSQDKYGEISTFFAETDVEVIIETNEQ